jgi:hypothetical protein
MIRTLFALSLLEADRTRPAYFCSPWMSDFPVFDNAFGEFAPLFPESSDQRQIRFSDFLIELASATEVRIVTIRSETSRAFLANPRIARHRGIHVCFADDSLHEKGILTPRFYLEGSMNITFMGVRVRQEKLLLHSDRTQDGRGAIGLAYLEFDRRWAQLHATE